MPLFRVELAYDVLTPTALEAAREFWSLITEGAPESPVVDVTEIDDDGDPVGAPLEIDLSEEES